MKNILAVLLLCVTVILTSCKKEESAIPVAGVTIHKTALSLIEGTKDTLKVTVLPDNATDKRLTWSSNNTSVAQVSETGEISAIAVGNATITATSVSDHSKTSTCEVTVTKPVVAVTLVGINNKPLSLLVGAKETLLVTVLPDNATDKSVTWTTSNASVATVSTSGEVLAVGTGVATIKAAAVSDSTKTDECVVTVMAPVVTTTAIGNFYYSDKTQTKIYDRTKSCLGIVFWVDPTNNQKGKIVSLDENELEWSVETESTGATNNTNGRANMYQINEFVRASINSVWENYPAFNWVATIKNGRMVGGWGDADRWYLPAQGDLVALFGSNGATMTAVNESLNSILGAVQLTPNFYWASNESNDQFGFCVSFSSGQSQTLIKFSPSKVRAIAAF